MGLPISVLPGDYTPGAETALQGAVSLINESWSQANEKHAAFEARIDAIADESTGWLSTQAAPTITAGAAEAPTITEPAVDIPASQSATDVMSLFDSKYLELVALLSDKFTAFRNTYFPDEANAYNATEDWLQAALANPDSALPPSVAAQIITVDKDSILAEAARASDAVLARFAAMRFPLPPGAAASAVLQIQSKAQDEIAATSRKVVMTSIEQMRFVVQQVMGLRQTAMDSAIKYITALASGPEMASRLVGIGYDAQSKLISAASQFYNSRIAAAEVVAKTQQFNVTTDLQEADRKRLPNYPVPAIRMGRLAVSINEQGKGHGDYLLAHAVARCLGLRDQLGVRVSQGVDGNAAQTVQVLLAVHVPHAAASAMRHRDRQAAVSVHDVGGCGGNRCRHAGLQKQKALRTRVQKAGSRAATAPPQKNIVEQPERRACEIPYLLQHNMAACPALHATPLTVAAWG